MKSEYIKISRTIVRKLFDLGCYGKGSVYLHVLQTGIPAHEREKVREVADALVKQKICLKKKKLHGWKYFLNMDRYDKIMEIVKETGNKSILPS